MKGFCGRGLGALLFALSITGGTTWLKASEPSDVRTAPVRIGMVSTLFRDQPSALVLAMMKPFSSVMQAQTGVPGELVPGGESFALARMLMTDEVQLAVLHGFEFAWVK